MNWSDHDLVQLKEFDQLVDVLGRREPKASFQGSSIKSRMEGRSLGLTSMRVHLGGVHLGIPWRRFRGMVLFRFARYKIDCLPIVVDNISDS